MATHSCIGNPCRICHPLELPQHPMIAATPIPTEIVKPEKPRAGEISKALRSIGKTLEKLTPDEQRRIARCLYALYEGDKP